MAEQTKSRRLCTHPRREDRRLRAQAFKSYTERGLTPMQRVTELDKKFGGKGIGAAKERAKLAIKIAKMKEASAKKAEKEPAKVEVDANITVAERKQHSHRKTNRVSDVIR